MDSEEYRPIQGYEEYYAVSNMGNVMSLRSKKILIGGSGNGYKMINLSVNGVVRRFTVHLLVAKAFVDNPDNKKIVDHINRDRTDNRACNLRWVDTGENSANRKSKGIYKSGNRWRIMVMRDSHIYYDCAYSEEEALMLYQKIHKQVWGEISPY